MSARQQTPWSGWRLREIPIAIRLRLVFTVIVLLMLAGSSFALWYLKAIRKRVEQVSLVEQRMSAVLQVDNSILTLMNQLHRSADRRERAKFETEAAQTLAVFRSDIGWSARLLHNTTADNPRQAVIIESLNGLLDALPARVEALVELARAQDWEALHARLLNQVDRTDDVVAGLVREFSSDLLESRRRLLEDVGHAEVRTAGTLAATGLLSLLVAGLLGVIVTRSITRPLADLDSGARSLARGDFSPQLPAAGADELAQLAAVFNQTASELKDLYERLQRSEARFRSVIENAAELILIVDRDGRIQYASPSTTRVLGHAAETLVQQPITGLLDQEDIAQAEYILEAVRLRTAGTQLFELRFRHQDGSFRSVEGSFANLLDDPAIGGIVVNARDVSDRRKAEAALREREEQLRQAQKMEAIGKLAGGVAHDFNNLLTVINGYGALLLETFDPDDVRCSYAKGVCEAGDQAASLTRQLLAFGRKQLLRPAVLNVNDVVRDTERVLRRVIGEDIELMCQLDSSISAIEADRTQLQQVLMNLAVNAREAMPLGGRLTIETSMADSGQPPPINNSSQRGYVVITIRDTGQGMDEATKSQVFEPFFTTKAMGKGTGLGLATVYGIVSQSGGSIVVDSEPGKGTTFEIYLPCSDRNVEAGTRSTPARPLRGAETVLIVEDQAEVRAFARRSLESYGYNVLEAADAEEALRVAATPGQDIQVVLTDVVMPGMSGVELSKRLAASRPDVKLIFASGYADSALLRHGITETGAVLIPKPYDPTTLAAKIRDVLDR